uniref:Uncharacterized protein n=1 Tax=Nelumbo nucifera TaxID=4432 RepID=A0A822ZIS2_NELNU|nr:TPA_asm: hypothetical protein HUJ06_001761 [Nelumbo nucifera]
MVSVSSEVLDSTLLIRPIRKEEKKPMESRDLATVYQQRGPTFGRTRFISKIQLEESVNMALPIVNQALFYVPGPVTFDELVGDTKDEEEGPIFPVESNPDKWGEIDECVQDLFRPPE